jgi:hypothetical protein
LQNILHLNWPYVPRYSLVFHFSLPAVPFPSLPPVGQVFSSRRISLPLPLPLPLVGQQQSTWAWVASARAGGTGCRLASTRHGDRAAGGGERASPHPQTTGPAVAATLAPSPATSTTMYALPLVFPSCCAKPCAQALTYYSYSDLNLITSVYACIMPTNLDGFAKIIGCTCVHQCPSLDPPY